MASVAALTMPDSVHRYRPYQSAGHPRLCVTKSGWKNAWRRGWLITLMSGMIRMAGEDAQGSIHLFGEHDARKLVWHRDAAE